MMSDLNDKNVQGRLDWIFKNTKEVRVGWTSI